MGKNLLVKIKAFTFVEILVVLGIVSLTLPTLFAIIFTIFQQEARIYGLKDIKQQGDYVLENIKFTIQQRGAEIVDNSFKNDPCPVMTSPTPSPAPQINIIDTDNDQTVFVYFLDEASHKIASASYTITETTVTPTPSYLTNSRVKIDNLEFSCYRTNTFSPPIIIASFVATDSASTISLPFRTAFKLRSY